MTPAQAVESNSGRQTMLAERGLFWLAATIIALLAYWLCLRFLFPGYFAPISPFHIDFYDYVAARAVPFLALLKQFPRPATYVSLKLLAYGGVSGLMAGGIAIALVNVLLTLAIVRKALRLNSPWLLASFAVYAMLLFAHPYFYAEHRHDLPAELSYFFLAVSLLTWFLWLDQSPGTPFSGNANPRERQSPDWRRATRQSQGTPTSRLAAHPAVGIFLLAVSVLAAILFAFAKETYFVSVLCVISGLTLTDRPNRWRHASFLAFLLAVECVSLAWNAHLNGPFLNPNAGDNSTYQMSFAPASLWKGFLFYLSHLLNPALAAIALLAVVTLWRDWQQFVLALAFLLAGLAAFATHAMLPNHMFEEYAWAGAPFFLAPVLAFGRPIGRSRSTVRDPVSLRAATKGSGQEARQHGALVWARQHGALAWRHWLPLALAGTLAVLAIAGPSGYQSNYDTREQRWVVREDRKGAEIAGGLSSFKTIPRPARILVVGLDSTVIPWESQGFVHLEFGDRIFWTVALPLTNQYRRNSNLVRFADVSEVSLKEFDFVASYASSGTLTSIRPVAAIPQSEPLTEVLVPGLSPLLVASRAEPNNNGYFLKLAAMAIDWGLWTEAWQFLEQARQNGGADATYQWLLTEVRNRPPDHVRSETAELTAQPAHIIVTDGTGVGSTELTWKVPDGVFFEIHVNAPDGPVFTAGSKSGHTRTDKWVTNGMQFFLQDVTGGKARVKENTLARVQVEVSR